MTRLIEDIRKTADQAGLATGGISCRRPRKHTSRRLRRRCARSTSPATLAATMSRPETSIRQFEADLPRLVEACRRIADYAAQFDIVTSVENHGFYLQASDRVLRLVHEVDRANFKTTLDIGNFLCVDEDPVSAVSNNIPFASMVHLKDFYRRPSYRNPGEGWFKSTHGNFLRGAIVGQGDIDMPEVVRVLKASGYDGYLSVEFEGMEDPRTGSRIAMDNVRRLWQEAVV